MKVGDLVKAHWPMYISYSSIRSLITWWYGEITEISDDMITIKYDKGIVKRDHGDVPLTDVIRVSKYCVFPLEEVLSG
jgi:hypothetical protein